MKTKGKSYQAVIISRREEDGCYEFKRVLADGTLKFLQDAVGGYIEHVTGTSEVDIWCNEEGKLQGLPPNEVATQIWWEWQPMARGVDSFVGPIVLTGHDGPQTDSVPVELWDWLKDVAEDFNAIVVDEISV